MGAGSTWVDNDLVVASRTGTLVFPGNFDQTLERLVARAGVPRLTSHGLRHTAATHWRPATWAGYRSAAPGRSCGSVDVETERPGGVAHAVVVCDDAPEVGAE